MENREYIVDWPVVAGIEEEATHGELIRCKDCKHFQMHEWSDFHKRIWPKDGDRWYECLHPDDDGEHGTRTRGPDWFCADGERRTD